jgi:hypothetical protein
MFREYTWKRKGKYVDDETNHQEDDIFVPGPIDHVSGSSSLPGTYFKKCSSIYLINTSVFDQPVSDTVDHQVQPKR